MPLPTLAPDPLKGYSGLSLFARTFPSLPSLPLPHGSDDLEQFHNFLKSKPLHCPNKLTEQGKAIVDDGLELVNLDMSSSVTEVKENRGERRPGLGRKRARFSLKPESSQPTVSLVPSLDIDKLNDPEEFFMAFERAENAKKEILKQTGILMDLDQNTQSVTARLRRPGILGRSVKYKHSYSTATSHVENFEEKILSPLHGSQQENSDRNVEIFAELSPLSDSQKESSDPNVELQEKELAVTDAENNVNELLDKLLTSDYEGDDTLNLLKESLRIEPIDLEKICLPDLPDIQRIDLKASRKSLSNPRDSLVGIQNMIKGNRGTTPNQHAESSVHRLASAALSKSPLASISLLKKRMLRSDVPSDPFSTDYIGKSPVRNTSNESITISKHYDQDVTEKEVSVSDNNDRRTSQRQAESLAHLLASPTRPRNPLASMSLQSDLLSSPISTNNIESSSEINASPGESFNKQSSHGDTEKEPNAPHMLESPLLEANQAAIANVSSELEGRDFAGLFDKFVNDNARRFDSDINVTSSRSQADLESNNLSRPEVDADSHTIKPNGFGGRVEDIPMEATLSADTQLNVGDPDVHNMNTNQREPDEPDPAMDEDHTMHESSRNAESQELHEQQNKKGKTKPHQCKEREKRAFSTRQSLAAAGTTYDAAGRRRSTRIRSRPLEFWKGERFLYGRIHSSLATVIGVKYESPAKADGENPSLKVKSFVSDEYKDLINLAARF